MYFPFGTQCGQTLVPFLFFFLFIPGELLSSLNEDHHARPKKAAFY